MTRIIATDEEIVIARKVATLVQTVDSPAPSGSNVLNNS
jgi:hypothetical protein